MRLAIMQPYIFPYIGYFQLINAVDKFVFLDDVNFINRGWINRNRILINGNAATFTIPLKNASQNRLINETLIAGDDWKNKILKTIELAYKKAPQFNVVFNMLKEVFCSATIDIATLAKKSIEVVSNYLEIPVVFVHSSSQYGNTDLKSENRVIDIALKENAGQYINAVGGTEIYSRNNFSGKGLELYFLKTKEIVYPQFRNEFVPSLSIIDVLMFNQKHLVQQMILQYEFI